jgi:cysteine desulfurase
VARSLGANNNQIIFTSGGTEANNLALHKKSVIHSAIEHRSVANAIIPLDICGVNSDGTLNLNLLETLIKKYRNEKICISAMYATWPACIAAATSVPNGKKKIDALVRSNRAV